MDQAVEGGGGFLHHLQQWRREAFEEREQLVHLMQEAREGVELRAAQQAELEGQHRLLIEHREHYLRTRSEGIEAPATPQNKTSCVICMEEMLTTSLEDLPCGSHKVCRGACLASYFEQAIKNQSQYPSKCCGVIIPFDKFELHLPKDLKNRYNEKIKEYHVDPRLRRYCPLDGTFLDPKTYFDIGEGNRFTFAQCENCTQSVCIVCLQHMSKEQPEHECKSQTINQLNEAYSPQTRCKACPFCGRMGILERACNHVTCELGCLQEFCFVCLEPWVRTTNHAACGFYNDPVYDCEGYDERGFHRDTGLDRDGFTRAGYNIRGLNRQGQRVQGFADRLPQRPLANPARLLPEHLRDLVDMWGQFRFLREEVNDLVRAD